MYAERQARYPKGSYKVQSRSFDGRTLYVMSNLYTGRYCSAGSLWGLVKSIEDDLSDNHYPQNGVQYRTWGMGGPARKLGTDNVIPMEAASTGATAGPTFVIKVLFRQNATWQGTIQWLEGRQSRQYRSVNELMRLMDEAADLAPEHFDDEQE